MSGYTKGPSPNPELMRIGDVPMRCRNCGHQCRLDDCNGDDPIGDGLFGCPVDDCGGEMEQVTALVDKAEAL